MKRELTDDERAMATWVTACTSHLAESIERLTEITGAFAQSRKDEGATEEEIESMRVEFCERLTCRILDLAARVSFGVKNGETTGDLIGHFADHLVNVDQEFAQEHSLGAFVSDLFKSLETEATHRMAKRHSEGN